MKRSRLSIGFAAILALLASACGASSYAVSPRAPAVAASASDQPRSPPHGDYARLRPLRSYFRLAQLGELAHHFRGWYSRHGDSCVLYEVPIEAPHTPRLVENNTCFTTGTERVPEEVRVWAGAIRDDFDRREPGASPLMLEYLGAYRQIVVEEIVVRPPPALSRYVTASLVADAGLTHIEGPSRFPRDDGGTFSPDRAPYGTSSRAEAPRWVDAVADRAGTLRLPAMLEAWDDGPPTVALYAAVLAAARRERDGEAPLPLEALSIHRDPRPVGPGPGLRFVCHGDRRHPGVTIQASTTVELELGRPMEARVAVGSLPAICRVRLDLLEPVAADASGVQELRLELRWAISVGHTHREGTTGLRAEALVEQGQIAFVGLLGSGLEQQEQVLRVVADGDDVEHMVFVLRDL